MDAAHVKSLLTAGSIVCQSIQYEAALQLSDPRFKKEMRALQGMTGDLLSVSPMEFVWKQSGKHTIGFNAAEVRECARE